MRKVMMFEKVSDLRLSKAKGIGLIEVLVAVALLAMMIGFAAVIFKVSTEARRTVRAQAEVMRKLRVITEQLDRDFRGLRKDAPMAVWFDAGSDPNSRFDQIMFFADGDFQSNQMYDPNGKPLLMGQSSVVSKRIVGNVARVHYGQGQVWSDVNNVFMLPWQQNVKVTTLTKEPLQKIRSRVLTRRQHILTSDPIMTPWPSSTDFDDFLNVNNFADMNNKFRTEDQYEHDSLSLSEWQNIIDTTTWQNKIIPACFQTRTQIDYTEPDSLLNLMCEGVSSFSIQWGYFDSNQVIYGQTGVTSEAVAATDDALCWFPSDEPDGTNNRVLFESHYPVMPTRFGVVFNSLGHKVIGADNSHNDGDWYTNDPNEPGTNVGQRLVYGLDEDQHQEMYFPRKFFPDALKFTIRLHDTNGILKEKDKYGDTIEGKTFTHIVYIGDRR